MMCFSRYLLGSLALLGLAVRWCPAADPVQVQRAVDRGVQHLRQVQNGDGTWPSHYVGATALVGLALMECDVPAADPAIQQGAAYIRNVWATIDDHTTYAIALTILFLDRLGNADDEPIIQALAVRLLAGQNADGGWDYGCPPLGAVDTRSLQTMIKKEVELKATELPKTGGARSKAVKSTLPLELQQIVTRTKLQGAALLKPRNVGGDNSNTQFAILGLWVARRHGVPVDQALALTAKRFRAGQNADGGWGYLSSGSPSGVTPSTASMTCAGLLALGLGYGSAREAQMHAQLDPRAVKAAAKPPALGNDQALRGGLGVLTQVVGQPLEITGPRSGTGKYGDCYYLLWSIERVAVAFDLATFGKKDWYEWGTSILLSSQLADGGWKGRFGSDVDTSFALLFLRRANLSRDLTAHLKSGGPIQAVLRGGLNDPAGILGGEPAAGNKDVATPPEKNLKPVAAKPPAVEAAKPEPATAPAKEAPVGPARIAEAMVRATGAQQTQLLDQLRQGKGAEYTEALATVIGKLSGESKNKARDALAERLARMTPATLRDKLKDEEAEVRRAAALACAMKEDKQFTGDLIGLLKDKQTTVARAAHAALKALTRQDFGPEDEASAEARLRAVLAWEEWWKKQGSK